MCALPAFTGYPVNRFDLPLVAGITHAWAAYFMVANLMVALVCGRRNYGRILTATALVTLPVVGSGACISFVISLFALDMRQAQAVYSAHYLRLCITMLTVVPLALGLVISLPLQSFEQQLLQNRRCVPMSRKMMLMALRVFNHIVYYVIPNIIEVVREERQFAVSGGDPDQAGSNGGWVHRFALIVRRLTHVAGEGICAAVQYIPLWAVEIARLPGKGNSRR